MKRMLLISILFINSTSAMYSSMTNDSGSIGSASNNDFVNSVVDFFTSDNTSTTTDFVSTSSDTTTTTDTSSTSENK